MSASTKTGAGANHGVLVGEPLLAAGGVDLRGRESAAFGGCEGGGEPVVAAAEQFEHLRPRGRAVAGPTLQEAVGHASRANGHLSALALPLALPGISPRYGEKGLAATPALLLRRR